MEEDIKIEKIINDLEIALLTDLYGHITTLVKKEDLEHLLKAYKELEEFKKQVTEIENTNFIKYKNYIPVSLVEEKIEELNKEEQELQNSISDEEREEYSDANISFELMDIEIKRSVLQELLEKRK